MNHKISASPKIIYKLPDGTQIWRDKTMGEILADQIESGINPLNANGYQKIKHDYNK